MKRICIIILLFSFFVPVGCMKRMECNENPDKNCACTMIYAPVCGCNGKTYGNACMAKCSGITEYTEGECKP